MERIGFWATALLTAISFMALLFVIGTPAHSQETPQTPCGPTAKVESVLKEKYGETVSQVGILEGDVPVVIYANPQTQTFTITVRRGNGVSCFMGGGSSWTAVEQDKPGVGL